MGALGQPKAMCVLDRMAAPQSMPLDTIRLFVVSKLGWICSQQRKLQLQERETPREFLNKESHYLWGKRHLLEISRADAAPAVSLSPKKLYPQVRPDADQCRCEEVLDAWYRQQVRDAVPALLDKWQPLLGVKANHVFVQRMKTKWGSCTPETGYIRLNTDLAKTPPSAWNTSWCMSWCICVEPTHNQRFIALMDSYLPRPVFRRRPGAVRAPQRPGSSNPLSLGQNAIARPPQRACPCAQNGRPT